MRLRNTILTTVLIPLFLILLAVSLTIMHSLEGNLRAKLQTEVQVISQATAASLGYALTQTDASQAVEKSLQAVFSFPRIYGAYFFDSQGQRLQGQGIGETLFDRQEIRAVAESRERVGAYHQSGSKSYYSTLVPVTLPDGSLQGILQVNRLNTGIEHYIGVISLVALGGFVLGAIGIVAMVWWGFQRHIERPLRHLLHVMERIGQGDRQQRATPEGPREYRHLSHALNGMLDALAEKDADLETRRRKEIALELRLHKSRKLAELGVLAAGVAHEIGAPLTVISGQAQRLARRPHLSDKEQARLARIRGEVSRITTIVRQLMELGRRHNLDTTPCRLDDLIQTAIAMLDNTPEAQSGHIERALSSPPVVLMADEQQMIQVITNLLRNAFQASPGGHVYLGTECGNGRVTLRVEDDGPGIPEDVRGQLFDPFFTTKPVGQGSGLGLAMTHRIVNDHGGSIDLCDSRLGGAGFELSLPLAHPDSPGEPGGAEATDA